MALLSFADPISSCYWWAHFSCQRMLATIFHGAPGANVLSTIFVAYVNIHPSHPFLSHQFALKLKQPLIMDSAFATLLKRVNRLIFRRSVHSSESSLCHSRCSLFALHFVDLINSKARLQAIAFICKPEYLKTVDFDTQTGDLVQILRDMARSTWFKGQSASWNKIYGAPFALRLTPFGFCFTFNIVNASDMMNLNQLRGIFLLRHLLEFLSFAEFRQISIMTATSSFTRRKLTLFWCARKRKLTLHTNSRGARPFPIRTAASTLHSEVTRTRATGGAPSTRAFGTSFTGPTSCCHRQIGFSCNLESLLSFW